ncbi:hypothetical protein C7M84_015137 [Penaeus vannamei]|uniref:Uncharacterized protein n=1 Tax=Penaeus vannamei TaxID=6689 RepID=A0A3R7PHN6_PENVA|nr:hypothetical protein C7M84_015137 [Penaeus vannamei]
MFRNYLSYLLLAHSFTIFCHLSPIFPSTSIVSPNPPVIPAIPPPTPNPSLSPPLLTPRYPPTLFPQPHFSPQHLAISHTFSPTPTFSPNLHFFPQPLTHTPSPIRHIHKPAFFVIHTNAYIPCEWGLEVQVACVSLAFAVWVLSKGVSKGFRWALFLLYFGGSRRTRVRKYLLFIPLSRPLSFSAVSSFPSSLYWCGPCLSPSSIFFLSSHPARLSTHHHLLSSAPATLPSLTPSLVTWLLIPNSLTPLLLSSLLGCGIHVARGGVQVSLSRLSLLSSHSSVSISSQASSITHLSLSLVLCSSQSRFSLSPSSIRFLCGSLSSASSFFSSPLLTLFSFSSSYSLSLSYSPLSLSPPFPLSPRIRLPSLSLSLVLLSATLSAYSLFLTLSASYLSPPCSRLSLSLLISPPSLHSLFL